MHRFHSAIQLNGTTLAFVSTGDGEPVVLVHGTLGSFGDFERQIPIFGQSYRVTAYSRRYHPPNIVPPGTPEYAIIDHIEDLRGVILHVGGPAHVVASSYGGYVALLLAMREPDLFRSLVLAEPPILPLLKRSEEGARLLDNFIQDTFEPARSAFMKDDLRNAVACFVDGVTGQNGVFEKLPPDVQERLLDAGPSLRLEFMTEFSHYMPDISMDELARLAIPVLLLEGRLSPKFFHVITNELAHVLPKAQRHLIPRTGHTMHSGNPEEYNRVVSAFLQNNKSK